MSDPRPEVKVVELDELPDWALQCREYNHHRQHVTDDVLASRRGKPTLIDRHIRCEKCPTTWVYTMTVPDFEVVKVVPKYPKEYLLRGRGRARKQEVRAVIWGLQNAKKVTAK